MAALDLCSASFADYLKQDISVFEMDLSNTSLVDVMYSYEKFKQTNSPGYSLLGVIHNLEKLQTLMGVGSIKPRQVTDIFYAQFQSWLAQKDLRPSTINSYCAQIKAALTWAIKYSCPVSPTYDAFTPNVSYHVKTIALSLDEVSHIAHYDLRTLKCRADRRDTFEKVKDMFVLSCNLGQRHSDMIRISPSNFNRNVFQCIQQKTGSHAVVDIDRFALFPKMTYQILEKYNYQPPYPGDLSTFDRRIRQLLSAIGEEFAEEVVHEYKQQGEIKTVKKPVWQMIGSHTARRTFVSNNVYRGIPEYQIRKCSGHADSRSFTKYICSTDGFEG